jgi:hypothetical protein
LANRNSLQNDKTIEEHRPFYTIYFLKETKTRFALCSGDILQKKYLKLKNMKSGDHRLIVIVVTKNEKLKNWRCTLGTGRGNKTVTSPKLTQPNLT